MTLNNSSYWKTFVKCFFKDLFFSFCILIAFLWICVRSLYILVIGPCWICMLQISSPRPLFIVYMFPVRILNFLLWLGGCVGCVFFFNHLRSTCLTAKTLKIFSYAIFYSESINVWSFTFRSLLKLIPAYDFCQGPYFVLCMWIAAVSVTGHWSDHPCLAVLPVVHIKSSFRCAVQHAGS